MNAAPDPVDAYINEIGPLRLPAQYCPHWPTAKQEYFLRRAEFEAFFGGSAGPGKATCIDEPVPTTDGWRLMKELTTSDTVFDADGVPRRVLAVGPVQFGRPCVEVTFSDGERVVCDEEHEWVTLTYSERGQAARRTVEFRESRKAARQSRRSGSKTAKFSESLAARNRSRTYELLEPPSLQAREAREIGASLTHRGRVNHSVPVAGPLGLPARDLPVDPYTLGVWLGDGTSRDGSISNDPRDSSIIDELPYESWRVPSQKFLVRVAGLTTLLRKAGVLGDKHIPALYLRASFEQRLAVLQGIVDTDGHIDRRDGRVEITLTRWRLVEGVCELAATLGIRFSAIESRAKLNGQDMGPRWRISFQTGLQAARLPRKRDAQNRGPFRRWHDHRYIVGVRRVPSVPVRCITVEGGVYLTGRRMVPTHNSWGLLMAALQYADVPGYHALLLRPTLGEFEQPGGLIDVSHEWLGPTDAWWHGGNREWTFPSGASLRFGYLRTVTDLKQYKGPSYSFCGFDELTSFTEQLYRGMFRILRQAIGSLDDVPLRMRAASNPGDVGHAWVKTRFVDPASRDPSVAYVPAKIADNPFIDYDAYLRSLSHMSPVDRERLINGDWDVMEEGGKFHRDAFVVIDTNELTPALRGVRYWDLAATEASQSNPDPDYTCGLRLEVDAGGVFTIRDIAHGRFSDAAVEDVVRMTAEEDGKAVDVYVEQEPGASGKLVVSHFKRKVLQGFSCYGGLPRGGDKEVRARPVAAAVANGLVRIVRMPKLQEFLDQATIFPNGGHDDMVDALSGAHSKLTATERVVMRTGVARGEVPIATTGGGWNPMGTY